jgi:hypothetical protein
MPFLDDPEGPIENRRSESRSIWPLLAAVFAAVLFVSAGWAGIAARACDEPQFSGTFQADLDISFGIVASSLSSPGTVTIDAATGGVTTTGGITFFGGDVHPARFSGRGGPGTNNCVVTLIFPASATLTRGGQTATLTNFTVWPASITLRGRQPFSFQVGATLSIPVGLPAGHYAGGFSATVVFTNC